MPTFYIYTLSDPRDNCVRYVGCSKNPKRRLCGHLTANPKSPDKKQQWINQLKEIGLQPYMSIVDMCDSEGRASELEQVHYSRNDNGKLFGGDPKKYQYYGKSGLDLDVLMQVSLSTKLHQKVKNLADKNGLTVSSYIRMLLSLQEE